jgi:hypothetical protein
MSMRLISTLVLAALWPIHAARAQDEPRTPADAARSLIAIEARSFQRDLAVKDWNALLTHFWPAKITARWEPPVESDVWASASLEQQAPIGSRAVQVERRCGEEGSTIAVAGRWARVLLPSCGSRPSELWMLEVNGRWKIVRLMLQPDQAWAPSRTSR